MISFDRSREVSVAASIIDAQDRKERHEDSGSCGRKGGNLRQSSDFESRIMSQMAWKID